MELRASGAVWFSLGKALLRYLSTLIPSTHRSSLLDVTSGLLRKIFALPLANRASFVLNYESSHYSLVK